MSRESVLQSSMKETLAFLFVLNIFTVSSFLDHNIHIQAVPYIWGVNEDSIQKSYMKVRHITEKKNFAKHKEKSYSTRQVW